MFNEQVSGSKNKKIAIVSVVVLLGVIFYIVYAISMKDLQSKREDLLGGHQKNIEIWVKTTTETATRWLENMDESAQTISSSELFRLFAQEMLTLDKNAMKSVQASDEDVSLESEGLASLVEQIPMMRIVLRDYVQYHNLIGARIASPDGRTIIASISSAPPLTENQKKLVKKTIKNNSFTISQIDKSGKGLIAEYAVPLSAVVSEDAYPVAVLLVSTRATNSISNILAGTPLPDSRYSPYLIQEGFDGFSIISNLTALSFPSSNHSFDKDITPFDKMKSIEFLHDAYVYAMQVPNYPFWVALEISEADILDELNMLAMRTYALAFAIYIGICLLVALLWWIVVGKEQKAMASKFKILYDIIKQQKTLLDGVNSSLQVGLALIDKSGAILLSNTAFEKICNVDSGEELSSITKVFKGEVATNILLKVQSLKEIKEEQTFEIDIDSGEELLLFRVTLYAYSDDDLHEISGAVCTFQDITEFRRRRIEVQNRQRLVIEGLLNVVEGIDPYLSGHSAMLQKLAVKIASRMDTVQKDIDIVNTSAYFSQIGKFYIPRDVLLKTGKLTDDEAMVMKQIPVHAFAILQNMDFGMPIADVVHQMYENIDGTGYPQGLVGKEISIYARILAVANIFLALTSPRLHREAFDPAEAIEKIANMKNHFDDDIVAVLFSIVHDKRELDSLYKTAGKKKDIEV